MYGYHRVLHVLTHSFPTRRSSDLLQPAADGTQLGYKAKAEVSGKLAQVGSRLIDGIAKKMAAEFFARFCAQFSTPAADAGRAASAVSGTMPGAMADGRTPSQVSGTVPTDLSIYRGLRAWRAVAIAAIALA